MIGSPMISSSLGVTLRMVTDRAASSKSRTTADGSSQETDGTDLFSRAMRAQQARKMAEDQGSKSQNTQQQNTQQQENQQQNKKSEDEELSPEEEERRRRWRDQADKQEGKRMAKSTYWVLAVTGVGCMAAYSYLGLPTKDDSVDTFADHHRRVMQNLSSGFKSTMEPTSVKLLPEVLPDPYQRPFTLCLELNDNLVHLVWEADAGWRVATRPGVKQLLSYLARYYEIIIFTTSQNYIAQPIIETIDPYHYAMYSLYRDSTRLVGTKHVKDISCLNRDIGKVIVVDTDPAHFQLQPENGVTIKPWKGDDPEDVELSKLMKFLEELALLATVANVKDLRPLLTSIKKEDPSDIWTAWNTKKELLRSEFAEYDRKLRGGNASVMSTDASSSPNVPGGSKVDTDATILTTVVKSVSTAFGALFGGRSIQGSANPHHDAGATAGAKSSPASTSTTSGFRSVNLIDVIEQAAREEFTAYEKEHKELIKQEEERRRKHEEEIRKQMQMMKEKKLKLIDYMSGAAADPALLNQK